MGFSSDYKQFVLSNFFKQTFTIPFPSVLFFSLHSQNPAGTGASELTTIDSPGYARAELDPDPNVGTNSNYSAVTQNTDRSKQVVNLMTIAWPTAVNPWNNGNPILYFSAFTQLTGGTVFFDGTINGGAGVVVLSGQRLQCLPNNGTFVVG